MAAVANQKEYNLKTNSLIVADSILKAITINGIVSLALNSNKFFTEAAQDIAVAIPTYLIRGFAREYMDHPNVKWALGSYSDYLPYAAGFVGGGLKYGLKNIACGDEYFFQDNVLVGAINNFSYEVARDMQIDDKWKALGATMFIESMGEILTEKEFSVLNIVNGSKGGFLYTALIQYLYVPLADTLNDYVEEYFAGSEFDDNLGTIGDSNSDIIVVI